MESLDKEEEEVMFSSSVFLSVKIISVTVDDVKECPPKVNLKK